MKSRPSLRIEGSIDTVCATMEETKGALNFLLGEMDKLRAWKLELWTRCAPEARGTNRAGLDKMRGSRSVMGWVPKQDGNLRVREPWAPTRKDGQCILESPQTILMGSPLTTN